MAAAPPPLAALLLPTPSESSSSLSDDASCRWLSSAPVQWASFSARSLSGTLSSSSLSLSLSDDGIDGACTQGGAEGQPRARVGPRAERAGCGGVVAGVAAAPALGTHRLNDQSLQTPRALKRRATGDPACAQGGLQALVQVLVQALVHRHRCRAMHRRHVSVVIRVVVAQRLLLLTWLLLTWLGRAWLGRARRRLRRLLLLLTCRTNRASGQGCVCRMRLRVRDQIVPALFDWFDVGF